MIDREAARAVLLDVLRVIEVLIEIIALLLAGLALGILVSMAESWWPYAVAALVWLALSWYAFYRLHRRLGKP